MNRLSCQESENEVALAKLRGQVWRQSPSTAGQLWLEGLKNILILVPNINHLTCRDIVHVDSTNTTGH